MYYDSPKVYNTNRTTHTWLNFKVNIAIYFYSFPTYRSKLFQTGMYFRKPG